MTEKDQKHEHSGEIELYGDPGIASYDAKVPTFLKLVYIVLPIWGLFTLYFFWNGSIGWFDRGAWKELQIAANTTYPFINQTVLQEKIERDSEENKKSTESLNRP